MHFSRDVNFALMSAFAWNEWTCVSDIFVILNFANISKKGNKFCDHKVSAKKNENVSKFWTTMISKWLVIIVSSQSILINTFFHFEIFWKPRCPEGNNFWKNRINLLITPTQAIGHKVLWFTNLFLEFFGNQTTKNDKFL